MLWMSHHFKQQMEFTVEKGLWILKRTFSPLSFQMIGFCSSALLTRNTHTHTHTRIKQTQIFKVSRLTDSASELIPNNIQLKTCSFLHTEAVCRILWSEEIHVFINSKYTLWQFEDSCPWPVNRNVWSESKFCSLGKTGHPILGRQPLLNPWNGLTMEFPAQEGLRQPGRETSYL